MQLYIIIYTHILSWETSLNAWLRESFKPLVGGGLVSEGFDHEGSLMWWG